MLQIIKTDSNWFAITKDELVVLYFRYNPDSNTFSVDGSGGVEHNVDEMSLIKRLLKLIYSLDINLVVDE
jgi:hypothetical protein